MLSLDDLQLKIIHMPSDTFWGGIVCSLSWATWPGLVPVRVLGMQISVTAGVHMGAKHLSFT